MSAIAAAAPPRSLRDRAGVLPTLVAEGTGPWDPGAPDENRGRPADGLHAALDDVLALADQLEDVRRRLVDRWRDVHAQGGVAAVAGFTDDEWLRIVARLPRRDARDLTTLAARLSALPSTATALHRGEVTVDQAATIAAATSPLSGQQLLEVDRAGAASAVERLVRGDDPDVHGVVSVAVERRRPSREVRRRERRRIDGARLVAQSDLDGGGWLYAELDPEGFATVCAAVERAAGPPRPTDPRPRQRAEGMVAMSRAWLGGRAAFPHLDADVDGLVATARPSVTVVVDLADATSSSFGQLLRVAGRHAPLISARVAESLAHTAPLVVQLIDGARPLAELAATTDDIPVAVRRAVILRDRGCRWPGCAAPPWQCDLHHVRERRDGGDHGPDNLVLLCRRHHRRFDGPHWTGRLDPTTGAFSLSRRRDGSRPAHTTLPHGRPAPIPDEVAAPR